MSDPWEIFVVTTMLLTHSGHLKILKLVKWQWCNLWNLWNFSGKTLFIWTENKYWEPWSWLLYVLYVLVISYCVFLSILIQQRYCSNYMWCTISDDGQKWRISGNCHFLLSFKYCKHTFRGAFSIQSLPLQFFSNQSWDFCTLPVGTFR